jgi:hypothetical protein
VETANFCLRTEKPIKQSTIMASSSDSDEFDTDFVSAAIRNTNGN